MPDISATLGPSHQVEGETLPRVASIQALLEIPTDAQVDFAVPLPGQVDAEAFIPPLRALPDAESLGAFPIMRPDYWLRRAAEQAPLGLGVLHQAYAFGGTVVSRSARTHTRGQLLLTQRGGLIPASFGQLDGSRTLPSDLLHATGLDRWTLQRPASIEDLPGTWFFLGSMHRHFGHAVLEGLARLWALDEVPDSMRRNLGFVVYEAALPSFALDLLELAGVALDRLVHLPPCVRVERLLVPDAAMRTHHWISSLYGRTWSRMRAQVAANARPTRRVYLTRRGIPDRPLNNEAQIESIFADAGYEIVSPDRLSVREQVRLAAEAKSLAGPVGSQLYLAAFQQAGARNMVLAPRNFYLKDDFLVSTVTGTRLRVVLGSSIDHQLSKPERSWSVDPALVVRALRED